MEGTGGNGSSQQNSDANNVMDMLIDLDIKSEPQSVQP